MAKCTSFSKPVAKPVNSAVSLGEHPQLLQETLQAWKLSHHQLLRSRAKALSRSQAAWHEAALRLNAFSAWRQNARDIGLLRWRSSAQELALLRAAVGSWRLAAFEVRGRSASRFPGNSWASTVALGLRRSGTDPRLGASLSQDLATALENVDTAVQTPTGRLVDEERIPHLLRSPGRPPCYRANSAPRIGLSSPRENESEEIHPTRCGSAPRPSIGSRSSSCGSIKRKAGDQVTQSSQPERRACERRKSATLAHSRISIQDLQQSGLRSSRPPTPPSGIWR